MTATMFSRDVPVEAVFQWARDIACGETNSVTDAIAKSIVESPDSLWLLAVSAAQLTANLIWVYAYVNKMEPVDVSVRWARNVQRDPRNGDATRLLQVTTALLGHDKEMAKDLIVSHAEAHPLAGLLGLVHAGLAAAATIMQHEPWMMEKV